MGGIGNAAGKHGAAVGSGWVSITGGGAGDRGDASLGDNSTARDRWERGVSRAVW